jgi:hypothetical protein
MTFRGTRHHRIVVGVAAGIIAAAGLTSCGGGAPAPTPAPPFAGANIDTVGVSAVQAYANTLTFDSTPPAPDTITVVDTNGVRVHALIAPEVGGISLTSSQLAQGRIVAVIRSSATSAPLGLTAGRTYIWVDSSANGWRSVAIPVDTAASRSEGTPISGNHALPALSKAEARFGTYPLRSHADSVVRHPSVFTRWRQCSPTNLQCCANSMLLGKIDSLQFDSVITAIHKTVY